MIILFINDTCILHLGNICITDIWSLSVLIWQDFSNIDKSLKYSSPSDLVATISIDVAALRGTLKRKYENRYRWSTQA